MFVARSVRAVATVATSSVRTTSSSRVLTRVALRAPVAMPAARRGMAMASLVAPPSGLSRGVRLAIGAAAAAGIFGIGALGAATAGQMSVGGAQDTWSEPVRARVNSTFRWLGGSLAATAGISTLMFRSGIAHRVIAMNPWAFMGLSVVGTIGSMMMLHAVPADNRVGKLAAMGLFNTAIAVGLAPLGFLGGPIVLRAAAYTAVTVGSLAWVGANSPSEQFLWMGGPLAVGLGLLIVGGLGSMVMKTRVPLLENALMYGGVALFSGFVLYDTNKLVDRARALPVGYFDPASESVGIYLDAINLFVRIAQILGNNRSK